MNFVKYYGDAVELPFSKWAITPPLGAAGLEGGGKRPRKNESVVAV